MKADGTVNRAALPAIFNPEDLNALEQALTIKDMCEGSTVYILTMGPLRAADIIRDAMFAVPTADTFLRTGHSPVRIPSPPPMPFRGRWPR